MALGSLLEDQQQEGEVKELKVSIFSNLSLCHLKLKEVSKSISYSHQVLELESQNVKAHFRLGLGYTEAAEYVLAKEHLMKARQLDPTVSIRTQLEDINKRIALHKDQQSQMFKGIFL